MYSLALLSAPRQVLPYESLAIQRICSAIFLDIYRRPRQGVLWESWCSMSIPTRILSSNIVQPIVGTHANSQCYASPAIAISEYHTASISISISNSLMYLSLTRSQVLLNPVTTSRQVLAALRSRHLLSQSPA